MTDAPDLPELTEFVGLPQDFDTSRPHAARMSISASTSGETTGGSVARLRMSRIASENGCFAAVPAR